ncbi:MAG TPA: glutathione S-transferase N-terminal domain-containing protein [Gaiellales bacterium]|jgi:glutaredoxin|nr:glutathione S-transferase N-terminal domain-containing protein [Gaiellales bacterium]
MTMKLHRCSATWVKIGGHPCWRAQKALDDAGIEYELVLHSGLRFRRPEVQEQFGQRALPIVVLDDGTDVRGSQEIARRANEGTLAS